MSKVLSVSSFYSELKPFTDFADLLNPTHYVSAPRDWWVLITDIRGSTVAIKEGRYKQVNMLGAACITCVLNLDRDLELPYVFGGDGSTLLVPDERIDQVLGELAKLQRLAKKEFSLDLRVGAVPLNSKFLASADLFVAKFELSPGNYIAQFRGSALTKAEEMVKGQHAEAKIVMYSEGDHQPNLQGLSCRLSPLKSKKGEMLSLICRAKGQDNEIIMSELIQSIRQILDNDFKSANPVHHERLNWEWPPATLKEESLFQKRNRPYWLQLLLTSIFTFFSNNSLKFNIRMGAFLPEKYKPELILNSDFKKYDETLRMVIDCTEMQISKIQDLLESLSQKNKIAYGLHRSKEALLTCMVFSPSQNRHLHFVDGADGGYALAAIQFKRALNKESAPV